MRMNFNLIHGCVQLLQKPDREMKAPARFSDDDEEEIQVTDGDEDGVVGIVSLGSDLTI